MNLVDLIAKACDGEWRSLSDIRSVVSEGTPTGISGQITHMQRRGQLLRRGTPKKFEYKLCPTWGRSEVQRSGTEAPQTGAGPTATPAFGASLGMTGTPGVDTPTPDGAGADSVLALFDAGVAMTLDELASASSLSRPALRSTLHEAVVAGTVRSRVRDGATEYYLVDEEELDQAVELPRPATAPLAPAPGAARATPPAAPRPSPADARTHAVPHQAALRERLSAIALDLEEALGDACDLQASHQLIKELVAANGCTHRALQSLHP